MVLPFIKEQFTATYIQYKSETVIDDTFSWLDGTTSTPPVLSFSEVRNAISEKNPELLIQLQQASEEMKVQQQQQAEMSGEPIPNDTIDFNKILKSDFSVPVGEQLGFLRYAYAFFKFALPVTAFYLLILLGLIALLSTTAKSRLRWIGFTFLSSISFCCIPILLAVGFSQAPIQIDAKNAELSSIISSISTIVVRSFASKYLQVEIMGVMIFVGVGIICFILSSMVSSTQQIKPIAVKKRKTS